MFVVEPARNPGYRRTPDLLPALRRPRVVNHSFGIGHHSADEGDPAAVRRPHRACRAFGDRAQPARLAPGTEVENKKLIHRPDLADEGQASAVKGPLGRMVAMRATRWLDRLGLEQAANDDAAAVLARIQVGPPNLVRPPLAIATQPDVVDPTKSIQILGTNWAAHGVPRCYQQPQSLRAYLITSPYRLLVKQ